MRTRPMLLALRVSISLTAEAVSDASSRSIRATMPFHARTPLMPTTANTTPTAGRTPNSSACPSSVR